MCITRELYGSVMAYRVKYQGRSVLSLDLTEAIEAAVTASKRLKSLGDTNPSLFS